MAASVYQLAAIYHGLGHSAVPNPRTITDYWPWSDSGNDDWVNKWAKRGTYVNFGPLDGGIPERRIPSVYELEELALVNLQPCHLQNKGHLPILKGLHMVGPPPPRPSIPHHFCLCFWQWLNVSVLMAGSVNGARRIIKSPQLRNTLRNLPPVASIPCLSSLPHPGKAI